MEKVRVVHYLNQFFGQIGGEELAGTPPQIRQGPVGPGNQLQVRLGEEFAIVATAICGDNRFAEDPGVVARQLVELIGPYQPQVLIAGPAFNSGRYGQSCAELCVAVQEQLQIPALTGMYDENPGVEQFRSRTLIFRTGPTARHMREALDCMAALAKRLGRGETIDRPAQAGCFARGLKRSVMRDQNAASRALDMLQRKLAGLPFKTEISVPAFDRVEPVKLANPLARSLVALVTDGGLVVKGNPERMPAGYTDRFTAVSIAELDRLTPQRVEVHHGGFDTQFVNADPERLVPLEIMREMEREGVIGKLYETIYSTAGLAMSLTNGKRVGSEIGKRLKQDGVQAAVLTST